MLEEDLLSYFIDESAAQRGMQMREALCNWTQKHRWHGRRARTQQISARHIPAHLHFVCGINGGDGCMAKRTQMQSWRTSASALARARAKVSGGAPAAAATALRLRMVKVRAESHPWCERMQRRRVGAILHCTRKDLLNAYSQVPPSSPQQERKALYQA